ncbi:MAG: GNAT family N-acetyltransferase [Actinobacteria bacterium]|nr:GNAT family N-acetyltransferase [Actinomycetota bacterium]
MMVEMAGSEYVCRRAVSGDRPAILALCRSCLGWRSDAPDEAFFMWKHDENAFGDSPAWVAQTPDGAIIGVRVLLRWCFRDERGKALSAVRAVDTATHPDWQGKGVFSALTRGALPELGQEGVDFVFNTPNDKSLPGYLKMGWSKVGKVPVATRLGSIGALRRVGGARSAAELWSEPVDAGEAATETFLDHGGVEKLLARTRWPEKLRTDRSPAFFSWRYSFAPLHYRAFPLGDSLPDGVIVFRVRRRGSAREAAVCDVVAPPGARLRSAFGEIARQTGADYLLASASSAGLAAGFIPAVGLGPVLTWRPVNRAGIPAMSDLGLALGDIELL